MFNQVHRCIFMKSDNADNIVICFKMVQTINIKIDNQSKIVINFYGLSNEIVIL